MPEQNRLELGGRDLHALVLDELLDAVDDEHVAVLVDVADVARVQPALGVDRGRRRVGAAQIALHHDGPAYPDLALLAARQRLTAARVDHQALQVRQQRAA